MAGALARRSAIPSSRGHTPDMQTGSSRQWIIPAVALTSGAVSVFSWAPRGWWPLSLLTYGALYACLRSAPNALTAAATAAFYAGAQHLAGSSWIFGALHEKVGLGVFPSTAATAVFILYLCLFAAAPVFLWHRLVHERQLDPPAAGALLPGWALAAALILGEWGRSQAFNGFTSLSMGYAWIDSPLNGFIPIVGIYGVGFLAYAFAFVGTEALLRMRDCGWRTAGVAATFIGCWCALGWAACSMEWVENDGPEKRFRLIQFNIPQEQKFDPESIPQQISTLTELLVRQPAEIVVAPETAFPVFFHQLPAQAVERLRRAAADGGAHFMIGVAVLDADARGHNSVLHVAPDGRLAFIHKTFLMPFGEYSPRGFRWFTEHLPIPLKDLVAGAPGQPPFRVGDIGVGALICHEDLVGDLNRRWADRVGVLINPSNLAWFDGSLAVPQRIQIARARAAEIGRPMLRIANTGITAAIDHRGRVLQQLPPGVQAELAGVIQPTRGRTPFVLVGDWLAVAASLATLLAAFLARQKISRTPFLTMESRSVK